MFYQYVVLGIMFVYRIDSVGECVVEEFVDWI